VKLVYLNPAGQGEDQRDGTGWAARTYDVVAHAREASGEQQDQRALALRLYDASLPEKLSAIWEAEEAARRKEQDKEAQEALEEAFEEAGGLPPSSARTPVQSAHPGGAKEESLWNEGMQDGQGLRIGGAVPVRGIVWKPTYIK